MRRISNSEGATWLSCKRKYYYAFDLGIAPKVKLNHPIGNDKVRTLGVGILGHEILGIYYDFLRVGFSHEEALHETRKILIGMMQNPIRYSIELVAHITKILERYWAHYGEADFIRYEIEAVEKEYDVPLTDEFSFVFRPDLVLRERSTGKMILWDHKFKYEFFSDTAIALSGQIPKYLGALRYNEIWPDKVYLNQVNALTKRGTPTSSWTPKDYFNRLPVVPSNAKVTRAIKEQIIVSQQISDWRDLPIEIRKATALRAMDAFPSPCGQCPYQLPCRMEYDGGKITHVLANDFGPNSYDYNRDERL